MVAVSASNDCLFCKIVAGQISAQIVAQDEQVMAFRDIDPKAPTHVLVIPVQHYENVAELAKAEKKLVGEMLAMAARVAEAESLDDGYRIVFNTGADGGQTVYHVHAHLLGGRSLEWPPG